MLRSVDHSVVTLTSTQYSVLYIHQLSKVYKLRVRPFDLGGDCLLVDVTKISCSSISLHKNLKGF